MLVFLENRCMLASQSTTQALGRVMCLLRRYCLGAGLALVEMKVLLGLIARQYSLTYNNNTEWVQSIGRVPKVKGDIAVSQRMDSCGQQWWQRGDLRCSIELCRSHVNARMYLYVWQYWYFVSGPQA